MKLPSFPTFACLAVAVGGCLASSARAEEPKDVLLKAQQAQMAAPACRMTIHSSERGKEEASKDNVTVIEMVNPGKLRVTQERGSKVNMEIVTDGKRTFMRQGKDGKLTEAPANITAMIATMNNSNTLQAMLGAATDVKEAGHETVDGKAATIYTFKTLMMGLDSATKLWVADKGSLPLKAEGDTRGEINMGVGGDQKTDQHTEIVFDYDSSIKITLPTS